MQKQVHNIVENQNQSQTISKNKKSELAGISAIAGPILIYTWVLKLHKTMGVL